MNAEMKLFFRSVAELFLILHLAYRLSMWRKYSFLAVMMWGSLGKMLVVWWCTYQFLLMKTCNKPYHFLKRSGMSLPNLSNAFMSNCKLLLILCYLEICGSYAFMCLDSLFLFPVGLSFYAIDCSKAWRSGHVGFWRRHFSLFNWILSPPSFVVLGSSRDTYCGISRKYWSPERTYEKHSSVISTHYFLQH